MARIRSIHPGFWTDELIVSVSPVARLLFIGIWNQCDDKGVFEWKPIVLRMRIFPADQFNVVRLLAELEDADLIRGFEANGRRYGAVRNFARFQRPKKPNDIYPLPENLHDFNGLASDGSPPVRNQWGKPMTEGKGKGVPPSSPPNSDPNFEAVHPPEKRPATLRRAKGAGWTVIANDEVD